MQCTAQTKEAEKPKKSIFHPKNRINTVNFVLAPKFVVYKLGATKIQIQLQQSCSYYHFLSIFFFYI